MTIRPVFADSINIVITADGDFFAPMGVLIESIFRNRKPSDKYDVLILNTNIEKSVSDLLVERYSTGSFSLRFIQLKEDLRHHLFFKNRIDTVGNISTWFRLLIPELMEEYDKVLYLDADIVCDKDISELFNTSLQHGEIVAAVDDIMGNWEVFMPGKDLPEYRRERLGMKEPEKYFNAGVVLFNLSSFRTVFEEWGGWDRINSSTFRSADQDVLNSVCSGKVLWLNYSWNMITACYEPGRQYIPTKDGERWEISLKKPNLIHYTGDSRPWKKTGVKFEEFFWKYAGSAVTLDSCIKQYCGDNIRDIVEDQITQNRVGKKDTLRWFLKTLRRG